MALFLALIHKEPGSAWGISFPDLPGCITAARSGDDVIPMAQEVLDVWFEHEPFVEPSSFEAVRDRVAEDLREGAVLLGVFYSPAGAERTAA